MPKCNDPSKNNAPASLVAGTTHSGPSSAPSAVAISDNQNSLKMGARGHALLEDFILREKLTHFDHERILERIVHARGSAANGFFDCYAPMTHITKAAPFNQAGKVTPVFIRFSTIAGGRGSKDTARDVRGFKVKPYTDDAVAMHRHPERETDPPRV